MKNLEVIEDLDPHFVIEFNKNTYSEKLYDCFIRNYHYIKTYAR